MRKILQSWLRKIFSDLHSIVFGILVASAIAGGGVYIHVKNLWSSLKNTLQSPIPLWAGIFLALLCFAYTYVKHHRNPLVTSTQKPKIDFIESKDIKWKVYLFKSGYYKIDSHPFCRIHDKKLLDFSRGYACFEINKDNCSAKFDKNTMNIKMKHIESLAEKKYRGKYTNISTKN